VHLDYLTETKGQVIWLANPESGSKVSVKGEAHDSEMRTHVSVCRACMSSRQMRFRHPPAGFSEFLSDGVKTEDWSNFQGELENFFLSCIAIYG
jgi:hypothetical protein